MSNRAIDTTEHAQDTAGTALGNAARRLFQAVARLLVGRLPVTAATKLLKQAYIAEARRQLDRDPRQTRITRSVLSLMTGLDARQIAAMEQQSEPESPQTTADVYISALEQWAIHPQWSDGHGRPAELPVYGPKASFQTLVRHVAGNNVTPRTVLQRLLEHGNVEYTDDGQHVRLINRYYVPVRQTEAGSLEAGSLSFVRLADTIVHNTQARSPDERRLQQDRWTTEVPVALAPQVCRDLNALMRKNLQEIEEYLEALEATHEGHTGPKLKIGSGWFVFQGESEDAEPSHRTTHQQ